jgi:hypothetical protein
MIVTRDIRDTGYNSLHYISLRGRAITLRGVQNYCFARLKAVMVRNFAEIFSEIFQDAMFHAIEVRFLKYYFTRKISRLFRGVSMP